MLYIICFFIPKHMYCGPKKLNYEALIVFTMDTCYILMLPAEILEQIPTGYRQWTLLQMTCTTLRALLRDYHIARDRHYIKNGFKELTYSRFIYKLINQASNKEHKRDTLYICTKCVWSINEYDDRYVEYSNDILIWWYTNILEVCQDNNFESQMIRRCDTCPSSYITIGNNRYESPARNGPLGPFYTVIYNELPDLYRVMASVKRLSFKDTDMC
jgi:hypothetical protein